MLGKIKRAHWLRGIETRLPGA